MKCFIKALYILSWLSALFNRVLSVIISLFLLLTTIHFSHHLMNHDHFTIEGRKTKHYLSNLSIIFYYKAQYPWTVEQFCNPSSFCLSFSITSLCVLYFLHCRITCFTVSSFGQSTHRPDWCLSTILMFYFKHNINQYSSPFPVPNYFQFPIILSLLLYWFFLHTEGQLWEKQLWPVLEWLFAMVRIRRCCRI